MKTKLIKYIMRNIRKKWTMPLANWGQISQQLAIKLGVNFVLDTNFAADLTIIEEASELIERVTKKHHFLRNQDRITRIGRGMPTQAYYSCICARD